MPQKSCDDSLAQNGGPGQAPHGAQGRAEGGGALACAGQGRGGGAEGQLIHPSIHPSTHPPILRVREVRGERKVAASSRDTASIEAQSRGADSRNIAETGKSSGEQERLRAGELKAEGLGFRV